MGVNCSAGGFYVEVIRNLTLRQGINKRFSEAHLCPIEAADTVCLCTLVVKNSSSYAYSVV